MLELPGSPRLHRIVRTSVVLGLASIGSVALVEQLDSPASLIPVGVVLFACGLRALETRAPEGSRRRRVLAVLVAAVAALLALLGFAVLYDIPFGPLRWA